MQCPVCDERMKEVERLGVSIDICPGCKGMWLDRGELEKLITMSRQPDGVDGQAPAPGGPATGVSFLGGNLPGFGPARSDHDHDRHREKDHDHDHDRERYSVGDHDRGHGQHQNRRRGSWLAEIFGGDD